MRTPRFFNLIVWHEAALAAARRLNDRGAEGRHLGNLGLAYTDLGEPRRAIEFHEQALKVMREIGDRRGAAIASWNLGLALEKQGETARAVELMQVCVDYQREIGHPDAEKRSARVDALRRQLEAE